MNVLYFLEPWIEMGRPDFRFGSFKGYIHREIKGLVDSGCNITLIVGEGVANSIKEQGVNLDGITLKIIRQKHLQKIFPNYKVASERLYSESYSLEQKSKFEKIILDTLDRFIPDYVISWESPINIFKEIYPKALVLHSTYGAFSRNPFPEMQVFDSNGLFASSFLSKKSDEVKSIRETKESLDRLVRVRDSFSKALQKDNPFSKMDFKNSNEFEYTVLLPLQVSGYFSFDSNCNYINQFDFLKSILDSISPKIRVVVTEHSSWSSIFTPEILSYFRKKYKNFFYHERFGMYKFCSQLLMPYVDGVITVSSSVGLIGLFFGKPIFTVGHSHMTSMSSSRRVENIYDVLSKKRFRDYDSVMYRMLFKWNLFMREDVHSGGRLKTYLESYKENVAKGIVDPFPVINDPDEVEARFLIKSEQYKGPSYIGPKSNRKKIAKETDIKVSLEKAEIFKDETFIDDLVVRAKNHIIDYDVIGFDVFDTLLVRSVSKPVDVFSLVAIEIEKRLGLRVDEFQDKRILSEKIARQNTDADEVTMSQIYKKFIESEGLSIDLVDQLIKIEEGVEYSVALPRKTVKDLFDFAVKQKKEIYIVSDIYHSKEFVESLLNKIGVIGYSKLVVSSDVGLQKHSGKLFQYLKSELLAGKKYFHIGDNPRSDFSRPSEHGLKGYLFPSQAAILSRSKFSELVLPKDTFHRAKIERLTVDEKKWAPLAGSISSSEPNRLGYFCLGPLLLGFSQWLHKESKNRGVRTLNFLSREGQIFKRAFDEYQKCINKTSLKTNYVYCSRRSVNVASISTFDDALNVAFAPSSDRTVSDFLVNRFGFTAKEVSTLKGLIQKAGFDGKNEVINPRKDRYRVTALIEEIFDRILENANKEREPLVEYYNEAGLAEPNSALVDIGYKGTMQASVGRLMGNDSNLGFYLITFLAAKKIKSDNSVMAAFLGDYVDHTRKEHDFCNFIPVIEFMLLADHPSFMKIEGSGANRKFIFQEGIKETERERLVRRLQEGALEYVRDYSEDAIIDHEQAFSALRSFLRKPNYLDAKIFEDFALEDNYGGNNSRFICSSSNRVSSVWQEGSARLQNTEIITTSRNRKKLKKLLETPYNFFDDSRYLLIRPIRKFFNKQL